MYHKLLYLQAVDVHELVIKSYVDAFALGWKEIYAEASSGFFSDDLAGFRGFSRLAVQAATRQSHIQAPACNETHSVRTPCRC